MWASLRDTFVRVNRHELSELALGLIIHLVGWLIS